MYKSLDNTWAAGRQEANKLLNFRQINLLSLNLDGLTAGKECGSILSSRLWEGELRDDTKNGCVAD